MPSRIQVRVDADQFDRLARRTQPIAAVAELIWNGLDAEAARIDVAIQRNDLEGVDSVLVHDNGHGMSNSDAIRDFELLGGSWKKAQTTSRGGLRVLHGKLGIGRFRAFAIGSEVAWDTTGRNVLGTFERTTIVGALDDSEFVVSDPIPSPGPTATFVTIRQPREFAGKLLGDGARADLVTTFALYLLRYPDVAIAFDGELLDPRTILARQEEIELPSSVGGSHGRALLRVFEWKPMAKAVRSSIFLCNEEGVVLHELTDVDNRAGIRYSAYLLWKGFGDLVSDLLLAELGHPELDPVITAARSALNEYLDTRSREGRRELIDRWKEQRVYPYKSEPKSTTELRERRLFDAVAVTAASAVSKDPKSARLSLRLIKEALENSPGGLQRVIREVIELTPEQLADFNRLLDRTNLAAIIRVTRTVTDRLDFLADLESLLFDTGKRERLLERSQLHKILENDRTWVFGEEYALAVSDKGLTKVLEAHRKLLGLGDSLDVGPVLGADGKPLIIDLLLSKAASSPNSRKHLVVELKRPSVKLGQRELGQITDYAIAVSKDPRFKNADVEWDYWLVGDEVDDAVHALTHQQGKPSGLYADGDNYRIWVRTWSQILEENRRRLHFYREHLDYEPPDDQGLDETLNKYLGETQT